MPFSSMSGIFLCSCFAMGVGVKGGLGGAQEMLVLSKSLFGSSQKKGLNP